jgi:hypothetical protein
MLQVSIAYNMRVRPKSFQVGNLAQKVILLIGFGSREFGKWSPIWEGLFRIARIIPGNAYMVETMKSVLFSRALNERYFKRFYPSVWKLS